MFAFDSIDAVEAYAETAPEVQGNFTAYIGGGVNDYTTTFFVRNDYPLCKEW